MTATLAQSQAILKVRYPEGRLPKSLYGESKFKFTNIVEKREDFTGELRMVALQNENPQGSSADFQTALGSLAQGVYNRFQVTRVEHFGLARIKGQALKAAEGNEGALVDLWKNETDGISMVEMQNLEIYALGNGSGALGKAASGKATATVTLSVASDAAKFCIGMRVQAISTNTTSATIRSGYATITGVDRVSGTLTVGTTWTGNIPTMADNDYLVRAGDGSSSGTAAVISGVQLWIAGGTSPAALFSLTRTTDPVRFAGQATGFAGVPMEEALIEASALVNQQGAPQPGTAICHVRDLANFKKALGSKVTYPKATVASTVAGVSFTGIEIEGDEGRITLLTSPFIDRNECQLLYMPSWKLDTLGPAPQLLDFDGPNFLRVASDDAYECRFGMYGQLECNAPFANIRLTSFGA